MNQGGWFRRHSSNGVKQNAVPDGLWSKCPECGEISFAKDVERNLYVCPNVKCNYHHRLSSRQRLALTVDEDSFVEMDSLIVSVDPLCFPEYAAKLSADAARTGEREAIITGAARIEDRPLAIGVAEFGFRAGSMGGAAGEKIARVMEFGAQERLPVVLFTASGGARMQEGLISLMQMAKTSAAAARLAEAAVPYIVVLTHPTTGGVYASYAALGDVILAEPGATVGLAGRRVGNQDVGVKLPEDFQTSEFQYRCGMVDGIVPRKEMRVTLSRLLAFFAREDTHAE